MTRLSSDGMDEWMAKHGDDLVSGRDASEILGVKHKRVIRPDKGNRQRIWRWLLANGCRDIVALEPVTIHDTKRGQIIEYQALCRQGRLDDIKVKQGQPVSKRKRMWLRYELSEVE